MLLVDTMLSHAPRGIGGGGYVGGGGMSPTGSLDALRVLLGGWKLATIKETLASLFDRKTTARSQWTRKGSKISSPPR